jgi:hypothetical protein
MGRNQDAFEAAFPASLAPRLVTHEPQYAQQILRYLNVSLVTCIMEGDEDIVGQTPFVMGLGIGGVGRLIGHCPLCVGRSPSLSAARSHMNFPSFVLPKYRSPWK